MYESLQNLSLSSKFWLPLAFPPVEEILASTVCISFFFLNSTADAKIPLDKLQTMEHKGSAKGNFSCGIMSLSLWCILWAASPAPNLAVRKQHRICITEWREGGSTLSYIFQNWNTTDSESVDGLIDFILKVRSEMSRSQRLRLRLAAANVRAVTQQFSLLHSETHWSFSKLINTSTFRQSNGETACRKCLEAGDWANNQASKLCYSLG